MNEKEIALRMTPAVEKPVKYVLTYDEGSASRPPADHITIYFADGAWLEVTNWNFRAGAYFPVGSQTDAQIAYRQPEAAEKARAFVRVDCLRLYSKKVVSQIMAGEIPVSVLFGPREWVEQYAAQEDRLRRGGGR